MKANWYICTVLLACCVLGTVAAPARTLEFPVATRRLKNGMKVPVQPHHSIPNVALGIFCRIGSGNERPGTRGLAHFFEP